MNIVIYGDIGWRRLYHVGDEAMTEAAIDMLRQRGIADFTLIAGQPEASRDFYGLHSVPRYGFKKWSRKRLDSFLNQVNEDLAAWTPTSEVTDMISAVANADGVLIAGGGNMNSQHVDHLYERAALARIAQHFGKPLVVSSQTIGPLLRPRDAQLLSEMIGYARLFGAREAHSAKLARSLGKGRGTCVHTMDDAILLEPSPADLKAVEALGLPKRYVVATISKWSQLSGQKTNDYYQRIAETFDEVTRRLDVDIVLLPHNGSFDRSVNPKDVVSGDAVLGFSKSGRIRALEILSAKQTVAVTQGALLSVSSRYHPTIFGPAGGVPASAIAISYYGSVKANGSLGNIGLEQYAVPVDVVMHGPWADILCDLVERGEAVRQHLGRVIPARKAAQHAWWDAVAAAFKGEPARAVPDLSPVPAFAAPQEWATGVDIASRVSDRLGVKQIQNRWAQEDLLAARNEVRRLKKRVKALKAGKGKRKSDA